MPNKRTQDNDKDANEHHLYTGSGITCYICSSETKNVPSGARVLDHRQRMPKGDVSTSQTIIQEVYDNEGKIFKRVGRGNGETIMFTSWT